MADGKAEEEGITPGITPGVQGLGGGGSDGEGRTEEDGRGGDQAMRVDSE